MEVFSDAFNQNILAIATRFPKLISTVICQTKCEISCAPLYFRLAEMFLSWFHLRHKLCILIVAWDNFCLLSGHTKIVTSICDSLLRNGYFRHIHSVWTASVYVCNCDCYTNIIFTRSSHNKQIFILMWIVGRRKICRKKNTFRTFDR